jgi:hypothetical protein
MGHERLGSGNSYEINNPYTRGKCLVIRMARSPAFNDWSCSFYPLG